MNDPTPEHEKKLSHLTQTDSTPAHIHLLIIAYVLVQQEAGFSRFQPFLAFFLILPNAARLHDADIDFICSNSSGNDLRSCFKWKRYIMNIRNFSELIISIKIMEKYSSVHLIRINLLAFLVISADITQLLVSQSRKIYH